MTSADSELRTHVLEWREAAKSWFAQHGRAVTIVVPSYRDSHLLAAMLEGLQASTPAGTYRLIVTDDASNDPRHAAYLDTMESNLDVVTVVRSSENGGFAKNVNRALRVVPDDADVVLMNSDVVPLDGWLAALQYSLHLAPADLVAPKMLFPDGTVQFCGGTPSAPGSRSFTHRYRHRPEYFPPATVRSPTFYATGAVLYIPAATRALLGNMDENFPWGHEDVDYSLRCHLAGGSVVVEPKSVVVHHESETIGKGSTDPRIEQSVRFFWKKHGRFFERNVRGIDGRIRIVFVTAAIGAQGRLRDFVDRLDALLGAGFDCQVWNVGGPPHFVDRNVQVRGYTEIGDLTSALGAEDAIKVCVGLQVAEAVWVSSLRNGLPVLWAREAPHGHTGLENARIEASYLPDFTIIADEQQTAKKIHDAAFERPVVAKDHADFAEILRRLAETSIYGDGRVVQL